MEVVHEQTFALLEGINVLRTTVHDAVASINTIATHIEALGSQSLGALDCAAQLTSLYQKQDAALAALQRLENKVALCVIAAGQA